MTITDHEFWQFQKMIYGIAGISMSAAKKPLVCGRLASRVSHYGANSYADYFRILQDDSSKNELQIAVDLLTTNETYFFREPKHFDYLRDNVLPQHRPDRTFRIWSAACSSGEEPYTLAMVLADVLGDVPWEIVGSDISTRVLEKARGGHYPFARNNGIPKQYLSRYCLKGVGGQEGTFLIDKSVRQKIEFKKINLNERLPQLGLFDVVFLRNVMIYFNMETKSEVVRRILPLLRPGGYFIVSYSESLNGITDELEIIMPSIYRKPHAQERQNRC